MKAKPSSNPKRQGHRTKGLWKKGSPTPPKTKAPAQLIHSHRHAPKLAPEYEPKTSDLNDSAMFAPRDARAVSLTSTPGERPPKQLGVTAVTRAMKQRAVAATMVSSTVKSIHTNINDGKVASPSVTPKPVKGKTKLRVPHLFDLPLNL